MCGIVGSIQTGEHVPLRDAVRRAMDHMVHRGPDGQGLEEFIVRNGTASSTLGAPPIRSEEHTSELQSPDHLVCRLLLQKKKHIPPSARKKKDRTIQLEYIAL